MVLLQPVRLPDKCWAKLGIDVVEPIDEAPKSPRYAITVVDYRSKCAEIGLINIISTADIISFFSTMWSREGYPGEMVSDNGPQFTSAAFEA